MGWVKVILYSEKFAKLYVKTISKAHKLSKKDQENSYTDFMAGFEVAKMLYCTGYKEKDILKIIKDEYREEFFYAS